MKKFNFNRDAKKANLLAGQSEQEIFTYTATDGTVSGTATLTITINGSNVAPVLADDTNSTTETTAVSHTNGSGKSTEWWQSLMSVLNAHDSLIFSIDGTSENFNKYRINAKWDDVENAAKTCIEYKKQKGLGPKLYWKHLVFSYNQDTITSSYELSKTMGFDLFFLQHSLVEEGNGNDWLATTRPFNEIEEEFNDYKNKSLL